MVQQISLMEFYQIEALRREGITDEEMVATLEKGDLAKWEQAIPHYDFTEIVRLYTAGKEAFQSILAGNYQIKFITFPGLQRILEMKFEQIAHIDYTLEETSVSGIHLREDDQALLKQILSANWQIKQMDDGSINIALVK